jgi:hypothetical protein
MENKELVKKCVKASLQQNYFLHFAGKWEGDAYKDSNIMSNDFLAELQDFDSYVKIPAYGSPIGTVHPIK